MFKPLIGLFITRIVIPGIFVVIGAIIVLVNS